MVTLHCSFQLSLTIGGRASASVMRAECWLELATQMADGVEATVSRLHAASSYQIGFAGRLKHLMYGNQVVFDVCCAPARTSESLAGNRLGAEQVSSAKSGPNKTRL